MRGSTSGSGRIRTAEPDRAGAFSDAPARRWDYSAGGVGCSPAAPDGAGFGGPAVAATSAAKSSFGFSIPSPSAKRAKPVTVAEAFFDHVLHPALAVVHPDLLQQRDFLVELLHPAFDHLGDDVVRAAGGFRLLGQHVLLALQRFRARRWRCPARPAASPRHACRSGGRACAAPRRRPSLATATMTPILPSPGLSAEWT